MPHLTSFSYQALCAAARDETRTTDRRPSCIGATAALVDVAEVVGETIRPLTVHVLAPNPAFNGPVGGRRAVGIGVGGSTDMRRRGDWAGHLVGVAGESRADFAMFLDPATEQINRPELGIAITPPVLRVAPAACAGPFVLRRQGV